MPAVTAVGVLVAVIVALVVLTLVGWIVLALLMRRGRTKRDQRLAAHPDAYPPTADEQGWDGRQA